MNKRRTKQELLNEIEALKNAVRRFEHTKAEHLKLQERYRELESESSEIKSENARLREAVMALSSTCGLLAGKGWFRLGFGYGAQSG